jgi:hypothetical protein
MKPGPALLTFAEMTRKTKRHERTAVAEKAARESADRGERR